MDACMRATGNLSERARDKRIRTGVGLFTLGLVLSVIMVKSGINPLYRLALIIPFWVSGQAFFSALYRT
jgi:hypothetical protein